MLNLPPFVWNIRGNQPGPTAAILAGVHGDELPGLTVMRALLAHFGVATKPPGVYESSDIKGDLYLGFGNPEAILKCRRGTSLVDDLNRCFRYDWLERWPRRSDSAEIRRARQLAPLLRETDYLLDLHATHLPSPPFVGCELPTKKHRALAQCLPVAHVLTNAFGFVPESEVGTTDAYVDSYGGEHLDWLAIGLPSVMMGSWIVPPERVKTAALYYEVGLRTDSGPQPEALAGVKRWLDAVGITAPSQPLSSRDQHYYAIKNVVLSPQAFPPRTALQYYADLNIGFTGVRAGQPVVKGTADSAITAPADGVIVLQAEEATVISAGGYIACIAEEID